MERRRVLLLCARSLLGESLERLLRQHELAVRLLAPGVQRQQPGGVVDHVIILAGVQYANRQTNEFPNRSPFLAPVNDF